MVFGGSHGGNLTGRSGPTENTGEKPEATEPTCRTVMASSSKASNVLIRIPSASMHEAVSIRHELSGEEVLGIMKHR